MPASSLRSLLCISSLSLLCNTVSSRHIPGHRMHRHHVRPAPAPALDRVAAASTTSPSLPEATAGNAVIADLQEITEGLTNLPVDLANFVEAEIQWLQARESLLSSFLSGLTTAETTAPVASATDYLPIPGPTTFAPSMFTTLCIPPEGAGPLIPCPVSQVTRTSLSTALNVMTTRAPYAPWGYTGSRTGLILTGTGYATGGYRNITKYPAPYATTDVPPMLSGSTVSSPLASTPTPYTFNADDDHNVAVYYGQTPPTQVGGLLSLCSDANVDIVVLAFVYNFFTQGGYPSIDFGPGCTVPNTAQQAKAPGLKDCTTLASEILGCQQIGKKVLVSLGGYIANSSFASDDQAELFAATLWNLFGAGTGDDPQLRPFGSVMIDGFDIDNENHDASYYDTFASALRQQFATDPSKTYYPSATPQCPIPDASIPVGAMSQADFVFVQFYNNPSCNLDSEGFGNSFAAWSANLSAASTVRGRPRVYIGAGAFEGAGSGYVVGSGLSVPVGEARGLETSNLGGIMLWDGSEALGNVDQYGVNYLEYAKAALQG